MAAYEFSPSEWILAHKHKPIAKKPPKDPNAPPKISIKDKKAEAIAIQWRERQKFPVAGSEESNKLWRRIIFIPTHSEPLHSGKTEEELVEWLRKNHPKVKSCWICYTGAKEPFVTKEQASSGSASAAAVPASTAVISPAKRTITIIDDD